jgi:hypothetical protein
MFKSLESFFYSFAQHAVTFNAAICGLYRRPGSSWHGCRASVRRFFYDSLSGEQLWLADVVCVWHMDALLLYIICSSSCVTFASMHASCKPLGSACTNTCIVGTQHYGQGCAVLNLLLPPFVHTLSYSPSRSGAFETPYRMTAAEPYSILFINSTPCSDAIDRIVSSALSQEQLQPFLPRRHRHHSLSESAAMMLFKPC